MKEQGNALIMGLNKLRQEDEIKQLRRAKRKKELLRRRQQNGDLDQLPENFRGSVDEARERSREVLAVLDDLTEKHEALEARVKVKTLQPSKHSRRRARKSGSTVMGLRRPGGQVYESTDPAPKIDLMEKAETEGKRKVMRHKVHDPTHEEVLTAMEKLMRRKTFDRRAAIQEMTEREKEIELRHIKKKRFW